MPVVLGRSIYLAMIDIEDFRMDMMTFRHHGKGIIAIRYCLHQLVVHLLNSLLKRNRCLVFKINRTGYRQRLDIHTDSLHDF